MVDPVGLHELESPAGIDVVSLANQARGFSQDFAFFPQHATWSSPNRPRTPAGEAIGDRGAVAGASGVSGRLESAPKFRRSF
jgi:hypothetical protein